MDILRACWAGAVFALMVVAAHPQLTFYAGVFAAIWTLGPLFDNQTDPRFKRAFCIRWIICGSCTALSAVAIGAIQVLPMIEAAAQATRGGGISAATVAAVFRPALLGLIGPGWDQSWEEKFGLSLLWVAAAAVGAWLGGKRARFEGCVCLALVFFSIGGAALLHWLPGFGLFQIPVRMAMLLALPLALLAGKATQCLLLSEDKQWRDIRRISQCIIAAGILWSAFGLLASYREWSGAHLGTSLAGWLEQLEFRHYFYWIVLLFAAPFMLWLLSCRRPLTGRPWEFAWIVVLFADLFSLTWPNVDVRSSDSIYPIPSLVEKLAAVQAQNPGDRWRVLDRGLPGSPASAPLGAALPYFGKVALEPILGYNPLDVRRYKEFLQFVKGDERPIVPHEGIFGFPIIQGFPIENKTLLDLLGTRFSLEPRDKMFRFQGPGEPGFDPAWQECPLEEHGALAFSFLDGGMQSLPVYTAYENRDRFPRAFIVGRARQLLLGSGVLQQMVKTDFRKEVLLEELPESDESENRVSGEFQPATIKKYEPNWVEIETNHSTGGYLVLTDVWYPGWKCWINGEPVPVLRADYAFRAVRIPGGNCQIVFKFEPTSSLRGRWITLGFLGLLLLATLAASLRQRPGAGQPISLVEQG
jgi:hypothetical protein